MKIGILSAMPQEIDFVKSDVQSPVETHYLGRDFVSGHLHGHEVVLVFSQWGKVASAITTAILVEKFKVDSIIYTGVAGAVANHINIGDIVVANKLYQHDMDATPIFPKFEIPLLGKSEFTPTKKINDVIISACSSFLADIDSAVPQDIRQTFSINSPRVYTGTIASGDQFIEDSSQHPNLHDEQFNNVLAVEMEGAAVAQACEDLGIPYAVLRTISDKADKGAHFDFLKFIEEIANHYARGIIKHLLTTQDVDAHLHNEPVLLQELAH